LKRWEEDGTSEGEKPAPIGTWRLKSGTPKTITQEDIQRLGDNRDSGRGLPLFLLENSHRVSNSCKMDVKKAQCQKTAE
jgi:hypothetical protein